MPLPVWVACSGLYMGGCPLSWFQHGFQFALCWQTPEFFHSEMHAALHLLPLSWFQHDIKIAQTHSSGLSQWNARRPSPNTTELVLARKRNRKEKKRKDSAGSDNIASMIKGGGYVGQTVEKNKWVRGVVCRSTQAQSLTVVACVILQSHGEYLVFRVHVWWSVHSVRVSILNLMVLQVKVCQRFVCVVFVDSPHSSIGCVKRRNKAKWILDW